MKTSSQRWAGVLAVPFYVLFVATFFVPQSVFACSCLAGQSQEAAFEEADAVFSGQVLSIDAVGGAYTVTFDTGVVWKGTEQRMYEVVTADNSAGCGYTFVEDAWYVVYAHEGEGEVLSTGLCSRTALLGESADLLALGAGTNPDGAVVVDDGSDVAIWEWLDTFAIFISIFIGSIILNKYVYPKLTENLERQKRK